MGMAWEAVAWEWHGRLWHGMQWLGRYAAWDAAWDAVAWEVACTAGYLHTALYDDAAVRPGLSLLHHDLPCTAD